MYYMYLIFVLVKLINTSKGDLSLEIIQNVKGNETVVTDIIHEYAGRNFTLTCKLKSTSNTTYCDDELSWGWKHKKVQFNNVVDLVNIAKDNPKLLYQFLGKSEVNQAVKHFSPLFPLDSGTYFCMSLKHKLFKIVQLKVSIGRKQDDLLSYFKAIDDSRADFKYNVRGPLILPKFMCTNDKFTCKSGSPCFDYEYVCDNVKDCRDGSDENVYFCGKDPCEGKRRCSDGRCISELLCCDKHTFPDCTVDVKPLCCSEFHDSHDRWIIPSKSASFDRSNDFTDNVHWNNYDDGTPQYKYKTMWIAGVATIGWILVVICVILRYYLKNHTKFARKQKSTRTRISSTYRAQTDAYNDYPLFELLLNNHPHQAQYVVSRNTEEHRYSDDLPTYDEATSRNVVSC